MHLEEHTVEEEVVGGGPAGGVAGQAGEDELLGAWGGQAQCCSGPTVGAQEALKSPGPRVQPHGACEQDCTGGQPGQDQAARV